MSSAVEATAGRRERRRGGAEDRTGAEQVARGGAGVEQPVQWTIGAVATGPMDHRGGTERGRQWRWLAFAVVIAAAVMDLLDSTITQVAAPAIRRELGGSYAVIEWVTAAYALAMAAGLLTGGRLGDLFGRRRMLLIGMAGFVAASARVRAAGSAG